MTSRARIEPTVRKHPAMKPMGLLLPVELRSPLHRAHEHDDIEDNVDEPKSQQPLSLHLA